ncbi:MAG: 4Fe-4S binding protein [Acutalibacteraceae bacterium]
MFIAAARIMPDFPVIAPSASCFVMKTSCIFLLYYERDAFWAKHTYCSHCGNCASACPVNAVKKRKSK